MSRKSYAEALTDYADKRIGEAKPVPDNDLAVWYSQHKPTLDSTATNRELNLVAAVRLLAIFENHQNSWSVVRSLNVGPTSEHNSLGSYFADWHSRVAAPEKLIVEEIANRFAVKLPAD